MSSDSEIETLDILSREVVIHCRQYRGLSALRSKLDKFEKSLGKLADAPIVVIGLLSLAIIILVVPYFARHHADTLVFWLALATIAASTVLAACTLSRESTIKLDESGLHFEGPISNSLSKNRFKWNELKQILFAENKQLSDTPNQLFLDFGLDGAAEVELSILSRNDLRDILLGAALWAPQVKILPAAVAQNLGVKDRRTINPLDFTELWQNKLDSRFTATTFVPLEKDCRLLNKSLIILGQVAMGGMAAVYLAKHQSHGIVVIKESVITGSVDDENVQKAVELFQREANLLSKINHHRIARIFDYFIEDGRHYLMLEHIPGRTLRLFIKANGPVSETVALNWGRQLAEILAYLHELEPPIIHRDLTPDNIIVGNDGKMSVIDFGAANLFVGTATGTIIGKTNYMPPEQFQGKATPQSDIYALGAVLHFITRAEDPQRPMPNLPSDAKAIATHTLRAPADKTEPVSRGSKTSERLQTLISTCLEQDAQLRPSSARELIQAIDALRAGRKV